MHLAFFLSLFVCTFASFTFEFASESQSDATRLGSARLKSKRIESMKLAGQKKKLSTFFTTDFYHARKIENRKNIDAKGKTR